MVNVRDFSTVSDVMSRNVKTCVALLVTVGVPVMAPVLESNERPSGSGVKPLLSPHV
jgi:hypothetical protein